MSGWEPITITLSPTDGRTVTWREPEWDYVDVAILNAWADLHDHLCRSCGRPVAIHHHDRIEDYHAGYATCTATEALDQLQAKRDRDAPGRADTKAREAGRDPERARTWITWTDAEGPPANLRQ